MTDTTPCFHKRMITVFVGGAVSVHEMIVKFQTLCIARSCWFFLTPECVIRNYHEWSLAVSSSSAGPDNRTLCWQAKFRIYSHLTGILYCKSGWSTTDLFNAHRTQPSSAYKHEITWSHHSSRSAHQVQAVLNDAPTRDHMTVLSRLLWHSTVSSKKWITWTIYNFVSS